MRTRRGAARHKAKKRLSKAVKGFWGNRGKLHRVAKETLRRAWRTGFIHRRTKKRDMRRLWITRLSAATRARGTNYSQFIAGLKKADVTLNRKVLSELAISEPEDFSRIVELAESGD
ncbi:MAG: 50S ribosomal protein L20 [Candidatus Brocadiia bacterium]|jgi:large subunit ribosomal protein L20|nr:50S ribosomal protein L20 [Candidatus Brocadiia bacterium]